MYKCKIICKVTTAQDKYVEIYIFFFVLFLFYLFIYFLFLIIHESLFHYLLINI